MSKRVYIPERLRHPQFLWWGRLKAGWPLLIWVIALLAAAFFYSESLSTVSFEGEVEAPRELAAPVADGHLLSVLVRPGDRVAKGQTLALFDSLITDAELALEQVQAERQFGLAIFDAEGRLAEMKLQQAGDAKRLEVFKAEVGRMEKLVNAGLGELANLGYFRAEAAALEKEVELYPAVIRDYEREVERTRESLKRVRKMFPKNGDAKAPDAEGAGGDNLLAAFHEMNTLRARGADVVSRVLHRPGNVVLAGDPVVSVLLDAPPRVTALLPERLTHEVEVGSPVYVLRRGESSRSSVVRGIVESMSPDIMTVAVEVTPSQSGFPLPIDPNRPQPRFARGRQLTIALAGSSDLIPGETVVVHSEKKGLPRFLRILQQIIWKDKLTPRA